MDKATYYDLLSAYKASGKGNPFLIATLEKGYSSVNCTLLKKVATKAPEKTEKTETETEITIRGIDDNVTRPLITEMMHLIGLRRSASNKFFEVQYDIAQCKNISTQIIDLEVKINDLREKLRYYNEHKTLPTPQTPIQATKQKEQAFVLPTDRYELLRVLGTTRTMISEVENELEKLALQGDTSRIKKREARRLVLLSRKAQLETALKKWKAD